MVVETLARSGSWDRLRMGSHGRCRDTLLEWLHVGDVEVAEKLGNRLQSCAACERWRLKLIWLPGLPVQAPHR